MTMFQMYLFTRLESINMISGTFSVIFGMASAVAITIFFLTWSEYSKVYQEEHSASAKALKIFCSLFIMNIFVYAATPTREEMAAIIVIPKILSEENVDKIQRIGADGVDIVKLATEYTKGILENKAKEIQK